MKADVSEQLHQLYLKEQPDIVFIECSGIAEPVSVLDACLTPILAPFTNNYTYDWCCRCKHV